MKKTVKILLVMMILMIALTVTVNAAATAGAGSSGSSGIDPSTYTGTPSDAASTVGSFGNQLIGIVSTIGSVGAIIILVILGLKYMMGSAEEKAEYKKTLLPYIIGAAFVFAASAITGIIYNFANGF